MFNHESFISIEKCLILTDLKIPNPCNEIDQGNYTSETILANISKGIHVEKIDDFEAIFDFLLIKSIDLSFKMFGIFKYWTRLGGIYSITEFALISSRK